MCTVLGIAQAWWTVFGLVADAVGFTLLAVDLMREYRRYRLVETLRAGAGAAERLHASRNESEEELRSKEENELRGNIRVMLDRMDKSTDRAIVHLAYGRLVPTYDPSNLPSMDALVDRLRAKADEIAVKPYRRAPIRLGVLLVLLGFVFQLIGSIPASVICR
jgi:hypothetical protein